MFEIAKLFSSRGCATRSNNIFKPTSPGCRCGSFGHSASRRQTCGRAHLTL